MKTSDILARADRVQQSRLFKVSASGAIIAALIIFIIGYAIAVSRTPAPVLEEFGSIPVQPEEVAADDPARVSAPGGEPEFAPGTSDPAMQATRAIINDVLSAQRDITGVVYLAVVIALVALAAVWLNLGLTMLALAVLAAGVFGLAWTTAFGRKYAPLGIGVVALAGSFSILMQLARVALSSAKPVPAIARTVLAEAVRLRLSMFFIVMLIFLMASLPMLLQADMSLRYRVQQFLTYGVSGSFHLIAFLTVLFAVATVTFDQRDKTIWQTITKPVSASQYVLGKFLGVWVLAGVLLAVSGSGVFLFVEYLKSQPAAGEGEAYLSTDGSISKDRVLLNNMVLAARESRDIDPLKADEAQLRKNIEEKVDAELARLQAALDTTQTRDLKREDILASLTRDLRKSIQIYHRSIPPGKTQTYNFSDLGAARDSNRLLFLRFKVNAGSNAPDSLYRMTFQLGSSEAFVREVGLGQTQVIEFLPTAIDENGDLSLRIANGDVFQQMMNPETAVFPPDGLEISFSAGSFRANFFRVFAVLWLKLAFLAMLGVCLGTFLSFPVACLVALTIFFAAEGSVFLKASLENYWTADKDGKTLYFNLFVSAIAESIAWFFQLYGGLRPNQKLVEGLRLTWASVAQGGLMAFAMTLVLYFSATLALRRRELATYSGQ